MYDKISNALDTKKVTLGLFIDLYKAFHIVNHEILLNKLEHYAWLWSRVVLFYNGLKVIYLSCRKQFVQYGGYNFSLLDITCGVPQGSTSGPLLFLVYFDDLFNVSKVFELIFNLLMILKSSIRILMIPILWKL